MNVVFVDTNVLIYSEDAAAQGKQGQALAWLRVLWARQMGSLSTQVLNEFYVNVTRKLRFPMPVDRARMAVRRYQRWQPWQVDQATVDTAWEIETRYGIHYWDALIVASAQHQGCRYLISEDMQHDQRIGSVHILNPFLVGPDVLDAAPAA